MITNFNIIGYQIDDPSICYHLNNSKIELLMTTLNCGTYKYKVEKLDDFHNLYKISMCIKDTQQYSHIIRGIIKSGNFNLFGDLKFDAHKWDTLENHPTLYRITVGISSSKSPNYIRDNKLINLPL